MPETWTDEQLKALHHVLMEVRVSPHSGESKLTDQMHVEEGNMTCRGCGHVYKIANGIPNMVSRIHSNQSFANNVVAGRA
jgi:multifunctional methyltransferase subunit TRM112